MAASGSRSIRNESVKTLYERTACGPTVIARVPQFDDRGSCDTLAGLQS